MLASSVISCSTSFIKTELMQAHPFNPDFYHEDPVYAREHGGCGRGSDHCDEWRKPLNIDDFVHFKLLKIGRNSRVESGINAALTVALS